MIRFICEKCGREAFSSQTEDEALMECHREFGKDAYESDLATVCRSCYEDAIGWWRGLSEAEKEEMRRNR